MTSKHKNNPESP
jgi:cytochrome b involved in lipid metabolism